MKYEKRRFVPLNKVAQVAGYDEFDAEMMGFDDPISCVSWENMGWCKDGETRWYHFRAEDGALCYTLKR